MTRVTIGVPVRNAAILLEKALQNLADQTYPDFQVIVLDNASTDETGEIAQRFAERDPRFTYRRQPQNKGALQNFVDVLAMADTPYFFWRAFDDTTDINFVSELAGLLDANPNADLAVGQVRLLKRNRPLVRFPNRRAWEPEALYRMRLLRGARATWIYGMFRTAELRAELARVLDGYPHTNGFDHLVLFPFLASFRVVGTTNTTFYQDFVEHPEDPKKQHVLDPGMMQTLRDDFLAYCLRRREDLAAAGAGSGLSRAFLWLYADKTYRWVKIMNARWRLMLGERPVSATKKYD
jgi:glycosyltransferase involved in cell wall biosynthesis